MDLCHCPTPSLNRSESGVLFCTRCNLVHDALEWEHDPRVKEAMERHVRTFVETELLVDNIMACGKKKRPFVDAANESIAKVCAELDEK